MSRSIFGWDLPPGCTQQHIDEAMGSELPCETCGRGTDHCICPECPICSEVGNPYCYENDHLQYTTEQHLGRARLHLHLLEQQVESEKQVIEMLKAQVAEERGG